MTLYRGATCNASCAVRPGNDVGVVREISRDVDFRATFPILILPDDVMPHRHYFDVACQPREVVILIYITDTMFLSPT